MKVLVLTRAPVAGADVRLLRGIGVGLVDRGASLAYACCPIAPVQQMLAPDGTPTTLLSIDNRSAIRAWLSLRAAVARFDPDVVLTDSERDTLLAALVVRRRAGIVRRIRPQQDARYGWRSRLAARLSRVAVLVPSTGETLGLPRTLRTVRAPVALPGPLHPALQLSPDASVVPRTIACVPDARGASAAYCLRAFARLRQRRPDLVLMLLGDPLHMQNVRIHAAALGLTEYIRTLPEAALFERQRLELAVVWIAAEGDKGALSAVAAMTRGLPVVVDRNSDLAAFVAHRITGLHAEEGDLAATIASVAQLLADPVAFRSTSDAAVARAVRLHSWSGFLDRVVEAIELTRAQPRTRRTRSAQPA